MQDVGTCPLQDPTQNVCTSNSCQLDFSVDFLQWNEQDGLAVRIRIARAGCEWLLPCLRLFIHLLYLEGADPS
jgi:hypothetical protein